MSIALEEISPDKHPILSQALKSMTLGPGDFVITEGERHGALFFLKEGLLRVEQDILDVGYFVAHIDEDEWFGEMAFLTGDQAAASVVAEEPSTVFTIEQEKLESLLTAKPEFGSDFYRALSITLARRLKQSSRPVVQPGFWG